MTALPSLPPVIAHRGASGHAPENSLAALDKAAALGATWVEFDVRLSADAVPVVHHDKTLARTGGRPDEVAALAWSELAQVDIGRTLNPAWTGERLPCLAQVVERLGALGLGANVELKPHPGQAEETARIALEWIGRHWPEHLPQPLISSFSTPALEAAARVAPDLPRGYLAERLPENWAAEAARLGCVSVHLGWEELEQAAAEAVTSGGYRLAIWTVNDPEVARRCRRWGADSIITDYPGQIIAALKHEPA
ncbi:glycerophosphodiester phosphodiesterase family protein [Aquibaculum arenosum]|uniref:Glycerophosphodiester phosphodiesterase family protein n=1 Tax=Aquibaculum arenosum TaxID=3032591 RepID=A0ABT5YLA5_9PROT|nr:glycerophosphodiester phosphodiesterase family protein [Fodinicurvata sp. CAU 1616]MDF2095730.1 glycerophosphodiester phosphodiesterase family protein [Fodinicurvata sp. CAU 1616]